MLVEVLARAGSPVRSARTLRPRARRGSASSATSAHWSGCSQRSHSIRPIECVVLSTDALSSSVSSDRASECVSTPSSIPAASAVVMSSPGRALLRLEQLVGEAPQVAERLANVAHHRRVAGERLQRDRRPVRELRARAPRRSRPSNRRSSAGFGCATSVMNSQLAGVAQRVEQLADQARGLFAERLDPSWREPGHDDAPEVLVVAAFGAEQGARDLRRRVPSGPARRIISKMPGRNAGSSSSALHPAYESTPRPFGVRTIHDSSRIVRSCPWGSAAKASVVWSRNGSSPVDTGTRRQRTGRRE